MVAPDGDYPVPELGEDSVRQDLEHEEPDGQEWWDERPSDAVRGALTLGGTFVVKFEPNVYGEDEDDFGAPDIDPAELSRDEFTYVTARAPGDYEYRVLAKPVPGGWEITALSLAGVESTVGRLIVIEAAGIGVLLIGLGLVAWWVISLGISPMRRMVDASTRIANGDLGVRLEGASSGTESAALAASLNAMIGRLTDALSERERSEARLREFVADASHELRTPLTTVLGYAQLHRKGALSRKAEQADAWGRTEAEATRMKRLVEDMLELARYDAEPEMHLAPTDVSLMVAEVLADAAHAHPEVAFTHEVLGGGAAEGSGAAEGAGVAGRSGAAEGAEVVEDAGAAERSGRAASAVPGLVTADVDGDRLRQAIINVVANAAQHGASHVAVAVGLVGLGDEREVRIEVADDGPGMTPEVAARATERFVRGETSRSRATGGAGLGLAITAAIVEAHHGRLGITTAEGEGTRVDIVLPQSPVESR
nr:HAMP domain-containing sensor histidine kinase [Demequina sp. TTPB684]